MKIVIITAPMMNPENLNKKQYPVEGNKSIEYEKEVRCPINGILAKTLNRDDEVKIIYVMTTGKNSNCEHNKMTFISELEDINKNIGASFVYDTVDIPFEPTKETYNKLITDLTEKIPENTEIYTDIT